MGYRPYNPHQRIRRIRMEHECLCIRCGRILPAGVHAFECSRNAKDPTPRYFQAFCSPAHARQWLAFEDGRDAGSTGA